MLVWCQVDTTRVYYQITNGFTHEESLETDRHGFQLATAAQLGILSDKCGFEKFDWLPPMNAPVFSEPPTFGGNISVAWPADFRYGLVPRSAIEVRGDFIGSFDYHTA